MKELHIRLKVYHELDQVCTKDIIVAKLECVLEQAGFEYQIDETEEQEV